MIEFFIEHWHPATLNKMKGHWTVGARLKKCDRERIALHKFIHKLPEATQKMRLYLEIMYGPGQRSCDYDAYWKSLNDALKQNKLIVDDSPRWLELSQPVYVRDKYTWGTKISLAPIE